MRVQNWVDLKLKHCRLIIYHLPLLKIKHVCCFWDEDVVGYLVHVEKGKWHKQHSPVHHCCCSSTHAGAEKLSTAVIRTVHLQFCTFAEGAGVLKSSVPFYKVRLSHLLSEPTEASLLPLHVEH